MSEEALSYEEKKQLGRQEDQGLGYAEKKNQKYKDLSYAEKLDQMGNYEERFEESLERTKEFEEELKNIEGSSSQDKEQRGELNEDITNEAIRRMGLNMNASQLQDLIDDTPQRVIDREKEEAEEKSTKAENSLKLGDTGSKVEELQNLLNKAGADPKLDTDGIFGEGTAYAVKTFKENVLGELIGDNDITSDVNHGLLETIKSVAEKENVSFEVSEVSDEKEKSSKEATFGDNKDKEVSKEGNVR